MKNIESNCCCFSKGMCEEVHVLKQDCPIKRAEGQRKYQTEYDGDKQIEDCTCVYFSGFKGYVVPKCEFYKGIKHNKKDGKYYINCCKEG
jgi:hypothetical protein